MFGKSKRKLRVADFDIGLRQGWHMVALDVGERDQWPAECAESVTDDAEKRALLRDELYALQQHQIEIGMPQGSVLVWVPDAETPRVKCILNMLLTDVEDGKTPQDYEDEFKRADRESAPNEQLEIIDTFQVKVDVGIAAGAYDVITYTESDGEDRVVARCGMGVFMPNCSQIFEFIFTTQDISGFDDFVDMAVGTVATLTVEFEK